eukprot:TRINITY_DN19635_c0_g1::TRINITY_DN19635_c0_g1_i1::g.3236::m.3236 TRINITY_DN19635_c0_g1::TRINITY_DN19635_c0_g1_i1::g.3236  ORF type:complete len:299 (+),score=83.25,Fasciclin/PF02469.17/0.57,Fasciclin/PF02469.17/7.3,SAB/PF04382.8/4e+03,SAB/PF04382.8/0.11,RuvC/PF02075.12/0.6,RuvC/PF02075.12/67,Stathmin/PF00836.14/0.66,Stathmin/PF00836.14/1.3,Stathmin/PF00836.14/93,GvpL_GvpF/PF06386.6/0.4,GvpL_GvpF/PF06386.6/9.8e+02 TRINITY_DN19635_c0_g1_i1:99-995(+)
MEKQPELVVVETNITASPSPARLIQRLESRGEDLERRRNSLTQEEINKTIEAGRERKQEMEKEKIEKLKDQNEYVKSVVETHASDEKVRRIEIQENLQYDLELAEARRVAMLDRTVQKCHQVVEHAQDIAFLNRLDEKDSMRKQKEKLEETLDQAEKNRTARRNESLEKVQDHLEKHATTVESYKKQIEEIKEQHNTLHDLELELARKNREAALQEKVIRNQQHTQHAKDIALKKRQSGGSLDGSEPRGPEDDPANVGWKEFISKVTEEENTVQPFTAAGDDVDMSKSSSTDAAPVTA